MKINRIAYKATLPLLFAMLLGVLCCGQEPVFYTISQEVAPRKPRIEAAPTNMVVFTRNGVDTLYVASGRLHWYASVGGSPVWDSDEHSIPQPGGKIKCLAATANYLYVLSLLSGETTTLQRISSTGDEWETILTADSQHPLVQTIYAAPDSHRLFAGARASGSNTRTILYLDDEDDNLDENDGENAPSQLLSLQGNVQTLTGLAYAGGDTYFLSTAGNGIYKVDFTTGAPAIAQLVNNSSTSNNLVFAGIIRISPSSVIAAERNGTLYQVDGAGFTLLKNSDEKDVTLGRLSSGALAIWNDSSGNPALLLAGITSTSSSYTGGYVEFDLTNAGAIDLNADRHQPGILGSSGMTSVVNNERYVATIGKHPINHLFQTPREIDPDMTLFASTQTTGLWSYRVRGGEWQWNAEE